MPKYVLAGGALIFSITIGYFMINAGKQMHSAVFPTQDNLNQEEVHLKSGEQFMVHLRDNPSTPFAWSVRNSSKQVVIQTNGDYTQDEAPEHMVGVPGTRTWDFSARGKGKSTITFELKYVGEPSYTTQTYSLGITVE